MTILPLQVVGETTWHLTWQEPGFQDRHYYVQASDLEEISREVRKKLQKLVDAKRDGLRLGGPLRDLAIAGSELRKAIFRTSGDGIAHARYVREKLLPSRDDWTLLISLGPTVYIPWGLAYDGTPEDLPDDPEPDQITADAYPGFWCLKYRVATLYQIIDAVGVKKPRAFNEVVMLTIVNQETWDTAKQHIPPGELALLESSLARSKLIASSKEFSKTYGQYYTSVDLLYVYCHANGEKLALSGEDEMTVARFGQYTYFEDRAEHPPCLVFLNGCQTAIGAEKGGFMKATGGTGFCGFIGTEAKVPDVFAMRFGARFFHHLLYQEQTVGEIMDTLRRQHFPLGLMYSTCCHPLFRIRRITQVPMPPNDNLSLEKTAQFLRQL